ncbi:MAG: BON domain-containing protein [Candidatus Sedimenticola endophacoides]
MKKLTLLVTLVPLLGTPLLQGCAAAVLGGGVTGVSVAHDRRSAGTVLDDQTIELKAMNQLAGAGDLKERGNFNTTSYNQVVLLTGQADSGEHRDHYERLVRAIPGIKRVINEIQLAPRAGLKEQSNDVYLTSKVKVALFDIKLPDFDPNRVKVVTERGVVYLMGLLKHNEADAVVEKARFVSGVKQVVKVFEYL